MLFGKLRQDLNEALGLIAKKLDLNETRYKNAVEKYNAVAKWLSADDSSLVAYNPDIYAQGSFALGTVVKPLSGDEYDIDLVCELEGFTGTPKEIKKLVGDRLKENKIYYPDLLEEMNRCWMLKYAGEFHMDILPARPYKSIPWGDDAIEVPDKKLRDWSPSNPRGYAAWFKKRMAGAIDLLEKMSVDPVPENGVKTTLQQAVQLLKRNRDIEFEDDKDKPISIIITTLSGHAYENQLDLFETLLSLVKRMPYYIQEKDGVYWVANPVNQEENFAEKWEEHPIRRTKFSNWLADFAIKLTMLSKCENISDMEDILNNMFGETVAQTILKEMDKKKTITSVPPTPVRIQGSQPWSK
jgi:hypothetical protein